MKIAVVDYDIGNVKSILSAFENQGADVFLTRNKQEILKADGLILPGVGAFSHGMISLESFGLVEVLKKYVLSGKPIMGICLGMQMLFDGSNEFGETKGLGLISGKVVKLPVNDILNEKLPHISWNELNSNDLCWNGTILDDIEKDSDMYFVHSFVVQPEDINNVLSTTLYSNYNFCSSVKKGNIYGCQFHPEKSGEMGLKIINNFIRICKNGNRA
jgi:glutamine amidotransferase